MAQSRAESKRDTYNYGQYLNQFPLNTIKVIREFERILKNICRHKMSITFKLNLHHRRNATKAGRPVRTYIQQLCQDTGCSPEDLPEEMNDREKWRERVRDIRATSST